LKRRFFAGELQNPTRLNHDEWIHLTVKIDDMHFDIDESFVMRASRSLDDSSGKLKEREISSMNVPVQHLAYRTGAFSFLDYI